MMKYFFIYVLVMLITVNLSKASSQVQRYADFWPGGGSREGGQSVQGRDVGDSEAQWSVSGSLEITHQNAVTSPTAGSAWFPIDTKADWVKLSAVVKPQGSEWVAVVVGGDLGKRFFETAQVWVLLRETGIYQVMANGSKITLKQGRAPGFSASGNLVQLHYAKATGRLSVWINGEVVLDDLDMKASSFVPEINTAGFRFHKRAMSNADGPEISRFSVEYQAPLVPRISLRLNDLNIYEPGVPMEGRAVAAGIAGDKVTLRASLTDYRERIVWQQSYTDVVSGGRLENHLAILAPQEKGYFRLHCEVVADDGEVLVEKYEPLAVMPPPPAACANDDNPFGAMVFPHIAYPFEEKEKDVRMMTRIGLKYVRTHRLNWLHAQPREGMAYQWANLDREVELYTQNGLNIIATTAWPIPAWASQAQSMVSRENKGLFMPTEKGMADALNFYREMATRYKGKIRYYEIGNEVDAYFWLGSLEHYKTHDALGIMRDYFDYFTALARVIRKADPRAFVAPSTTATTEGDAYRPWLTTELGFGLGKEMSAFGTHYSADLPYVLDKFDEYSVPGSMPIILTEIGGISRALDGTNPYGLEMKKSIRADYLQMVGQLGSGANVRALCKFLLREQNTYGGEGVMWAGLLGNDFTIRPSYVAYATLVNQLAGAVFDHPLNIVKRSDAGWTQGYAFERSGQQINVIFLHGAKSGNIRLNSSAKSLQVVDVMGNYTDVPVLNGEAEISMDPVLPVFVLGPVSGDLGRLEIPKNRMIQSTVLQLKNPDFESGDISGWRVLIDEKGGRAVAENQPGFKVTTDSATMHTGHYSARFDAPVPTGWYGISQELPLAQIPRPGPGEYLKFKVSLYAKGVEVYGKGLGYTLAFRREDFSRFYFKGSSYFGFGGTYDWKELSGENIVKVWQDQTKRISLDIIMGLSTGKVWVDDVKVQIELWREAGVE